MAAPDAAHDGGLLCPTANPWGACGVAVADFSHSGPFQSSTELVPGSGTVTEVVPTGGGTGSTTLVLTIDGTSHRLELPSSPALVAGDEVTVSADDYGFLLTRGEAFVAYAGALAADENDPRFRAAADGDDAQLVLGDMTFELEPACAGPFDRNDSCGVDVGIVAFALGRGEALVGGGESAALSFDGSTRMVAVRRILIRDDRFASQCETCADGGWFPLVDVRIVASP